MSAPKYAHTPPEQAAILTDRLMGYYPTAQASDLRVFAAGVIELLTCYPPSITERAVSAIRGLPARFKFFPSIAEIREAMEEWAEDERRHADLLTRYKPQPLALPAPSRHSGSMVDEICQQYGIRAIPHGWDAVDVVKAHARHGARLPEVVDEILQSGIRGCHVDGPAARIVEHARRAMAERMGRDPDDLSPTEAWCKAENERLDRLDAPTEAAAE